MDLSEKVKQKILRESYFVDTNYIDNLLGMNYKNKWVEVICAFFQHIKLVIMPVCRLQRRPERGSSTGGLFLFKSSGVDVHE